MSGARYDYPVHPLALLFPELSPDEFRKLKANMELYGQIEPVTLSKDGDAVLDGRHRLRACKELGIAPRIERFDAKPGQSEADYIFAKNFLRRHLTDDQKAMIATKWSDAERAAAKDRMLAGKRDPRAETPKGRTRKAIARKAGVSESKARQAETVARHRPDLLAKVESGEMKLKDAVREVRRPIYGGRTMSAAGSESLERFLHHGHTYKGAASEPNGKKPETPIVNAFVWLCSVLTNFERENYATVEPEEMRERISLDRLEILANCKDWMDKILRTAET